MTITIDLQHIDYLFVNDIEIKQAYVDGVLVFDGPEPGIITQYVLEARIGADGVGYTFVPLIGDLIPREWIGQIVSAVTDVISDNTFTIIMDSTVDLGQPYFHMFGVFFETLAVEKFTADAIYSFNGTQCIWKWAGQLGLIEEDYPCVIYEKKLPENVTDFNFLPARSQNGASVGYTSVKYQNDVFGDLEPPTYKSATVGVILENYSTGDFLFGFEDVGLSIDYWREIEFYELGLTFYSADADYYTDENGTFWGFPASSPNFISGTNYHMRVRGKQEFLYATQMTMFTSRQDSFVGYSRVNQLNFGGLTPDDLKGHFVSSVMSDGSGNFIITSGVIDLPQGYWHTVILKDPLNATQSYKSIESLFNNVGDEPSIEPNTWTFPAAFPNFNIDWDYEVTFLSDNLIITEGLNQAHRYLVTAGQTDQVMNINMTDHSYRTTEFLSIRVYPNGVFGVVIAGIDKLQTYWKKLRIPELDWEILSEDMNYDRKTFPGNLIWYANNNLPLLVDGQSYSLDVYW